VWTILITLIIEQLLVNVRAPSAAGMLVLRRR
jgi:hypothetical protein